MGETSAVLLFVGLFTVLCATADWNWFMEHRKTRLWVKLFGRNGARIFYIIFGGVLTTLGVLASVGIIGQP